MSHPPGGISAWKPAWVVHKMRRVVQELKALPQLAQLPVGVEGDLSQVAATKERERLS